MSLLPLFDLSLRGRAAVTGLECARADGSVVSFTFGELDARSDRLAGLLRARGLKSGDRLAFFLQNRIEVVDLWLAGVKLGLIVVPVNVQFLPRTLPTYPAPKSRRV